VHVRRPRLGAIVAFSGLDGSGKSTQAEALSDALVRLGVDTERAWVPLGSSERLQQVAGAAKRMLRRGSGEDDRLLWNPGGRAGRRSFAVEAAAAAWSTAGTVANGLAHLRAAAAAAAAGKVVVFDRYVLDTIVHLRFTYGGVPHPAQERLVQALSPTPIAAYFLDLPPDVAHARKQDWDLDFLEAQAALYRAEADRLGIRRLDATRPREELAAEIAREVWGRLAAP
jgi:thymidylate kinase